jgi:hypothetical protein
MSGVWALLHRALYPLARLAAGRKPDPTVVIMDGQSVKTAGQGGVRGFDGHKRVNGRKRRVSRTHRLNKEVWCCTRDEGRPLEVGSQVQASNRCKLRSSKAIVVSVAEKPGLDFGRYDPERRAQANRR